MRRSWPLILAMVVGALLRLYNLEHFHSLDSDEAVYAQAAYALVSGQVPYRDFFFAGPPVSLYLSAAIVSISPSVVSVRALNAVIGILTIPILFRLSLRFYPSRTTAIGAGWLFAIFPYTAYLNKLGILENLLMFLLMLSLLFFMKGRTTGKARPLLLAGLLFGTAIMTKYSAVWMILPILGLLLWRRDLRSTLLVVAGILVVPAAVVLSLAATGVWDSFFVETIAWQFIRLGQEPEERLWSFFQYVAAVFPLLLLGVIPLAKRRHGPEEIILGIVILVVLLGQLAGRTLFFHYYVMLTPLLCVLAARGIEIAARKVWLTLQRVVNRAEAAHKILALRLLAVAAVGILLVVPYASVVERTYSEPLPAAGAMFDDGTSGALAREKREIAWYIEAVTASTDLIWTSDAGLAFLSHRLIVPAQVRYWRFQGFFEDVWGYSGIDKYRGAIPGYPNGLIELSMILESWEAFRPKVIVLVRTGAVDFFVWHGIQNSDTYQAGLAAYVLANYHLGPLVQGVGSTFYPSNTEVWVRN